MKSRATGLLLSLAGAAAVALAAPSAQAAPCSSGVESGLELATIFSSIIPNGGTFAAAGFSLIGMLACDGAEPLTGKEVLEIVRLENQTVALDQAENSVDTANKALIRLGEDLQGAAYADQPLNSLDVKEADVLRVRIEGIYFFIREAENDVLAALTKPINSRMSYTLTPVLMLAHQKIALAQLFASLGPNANLALDIAEEVLEDIAAYRAESDRLRGISIASYHFNRYNGELSEFRLERSGAAFGPKRKFVCDDPRCLDLDLPEAAQAFHASMQAIGEIAGPLFRQLDAQDAQLALLEARARSILADPFASVDTVAAAPETPVMLENAHPNAEDRCLFNRVGYLDLDGELQSGATRMRGCAPASSHEQWILRANGHVRAAQPSCA
ncbi:hypothetical protein OV079_23985 [Nannocystis pusilla]|uniref:Uncharacterized protein n=1 Tax=Nannocystis pusilla TaxID=889268 RepID=A0A9X3IZG8_9BACT|nr:hypothetical protein [Nannocystis pusilla]MCY1008564.1 hypothetical protein [Nannocystis pusilla]